MRACILSLTEARYACAMRGDRFRTEIQSAWTAALHQTNAYPMARVPNIDRRRIRTHTIPPGQVVRRLCSGDHIKERRFHPGHSGNRTAPSWYDSWIGLDHLGRMDQRNRKSDLYLSDAMDRSAPTDSERFPVALPFQRADAGNPGRDPSAGAPMGSLSIGRRPDLASGKLVHFQDR